MEKTKIVAIVGPTGVGKTSVAIELACLFGAEIISADSRQVYKYMDIGTAKPSKKEREAARHHVIDAVLPDRGYSAVRFKRDAEGALADILARGKRAFLAGGTGLYVRAFLYGLFEGPGRIAFVREELFRKAGLSGADCLHKELFAVDPASALRIHPNNTQRIIRALEVYLSTGRPISAFQAEHGFSEDNYEILKIGLIKDRDALYHDIETRVDRMVKDGFLEEVRGLIEMGFSPDLKGMEALGYREIAEFLKGECAFDEAVARLKKNTRNYAKRQITWFKKDEGIRWFSPDKREDIISLVRGFYSEG